MLIRLRFCCFFTVFQLLNGDFPGEKQGHNPKTPHLPGLMFDAGRFTKVCLKESARRKAGYAARQAH
jgi:hypothetical protein